MKTYVITLSKNFMKGHPKECTPTMFKQKLIKKEKIHTISSNYELWLKRINEVNEGKAILSLREWSVLPYRSKQVEIQRLTKESGLGIQLLSMYKPNCDEIYWQIDVEKKDISLNEIAKNDGLDITDFRRWFFPYKTAKNVSFEGAIIHFTPFRY